jgi:hypothetical protein
MNRESSEAAMVCSECGAAIECCELCGHEPCPTALCFQCLNLAVGQVVAHPHTHGG